MACGRAARSGSGNSVTCPVRGDPADLPSDDRVRRDGGERAALARAVAARRPGESALAALHRAFADAVSARDPVAGFSGRRFARMIADSPTLTACLRGLHDRREHHLAQALADATGAQSDDITVQTAAGLLGTVHRVLFQRIQTLRLAGRPNDEIARAITAEAARAFDLLEPALSDYA